MNLKNIFSDLKSGIVVFLIALPLCLGIALACNVPAFSGILAGIIGGIVVTAFSASPLSVSGPAAGLTSIILSSVSILGSYEFFLSAVVLAGILQIFFSYLKAGAIREFIPGSVIKGMLAGIGLILIAKQLPHLVGYDKDPEGDFDFTQPDGHNTFSELFYMFDNVSPGAVITGSLSVMILLLTNTTPWKKNRILSTVPAPLIVVFFGILCAKILASWPGLVISQEHMVHLPEIKDMNGLRSAWIRPDFSMVFEKKFWIIVITLAFVASLESLLSIEAIDKLDARMRTSDSNKELKAQGIGNIICGLTGALPVTAVIIRGSANISAGAQTKLSAIVHAVLLGVGVIFIPALLVQIPNATLAALLIMTGYKLTTFGLFREQLKKGNARFIPFITTIGVMLLTDLLSGVAAGIAMAVIFIIRENIRVSFDATTNVVDGRQHYLVKLPTHVTFFNKRALLLHLNSVSPGSKLIIDGTNNKSTDGEVKDEIYFFLRVAAQKQIEVNLINYSIC